MAPFMASTPRHHVVGRPQPLQQHHEGEGVPAARSPAAVVVGPRGDPYRLPAAPAPAAVVLAPRGAPARLPAVLAQPVQLGQEGTHRPVLGLLAPLLHVLADRVLPPGPDAISIGGGGARGPPRRVSARRPRRG